MSDNELILRVLKAAERRIRGNRILNDTSVGLAVALLFPLGLKAVDLIFPLRLTTVGICFGVWAVATVSWIVWRVRGRGEALPGVAASVDKEAGAHDQLKTAYWFIRNPQDSPWVQAQIQRAAKDAEKIRVHTLYPRRFPRASYLAISLIFILAVLNFLPLPWNHNWFQLQGAPDFTLSKADKTALEQAMELLKKAEELQQTDLAERLAQIMKALQDGSMSKDQLSRNLSELQQALAERNLDAGRIVDGLERVAKALEPSPLTEPTAHEIFQLDLKTAAQEVREIAQALDRAPEAALREMAARFQEASDVAGAGLEQLAQNMRQTADAMRQLDTAGGQRGLEATAKELERLERVLQSQRLQAEAGRELSSVQDSVGGTPGELGEGEQGEGEGQGQGEGEGEGEGEGQGEGQGTGQGEGQGEGEGQGQGEGDGGEGQGEGEGEGEGEGDGEGDQGRGGGRGGKRAGLSGPLPMRGEPTSLETQLDKEPLPVRPTRGSRPETIEEASQRERSKLDYRNVKSNLTPAQKDLLNQDPIPFEQRQFVKEYMESVRP